ncbi:IS481 family transposase [Mycobacterium simiae]|uniref:IS481 family transposase n=1 Tax=Mycobacterium simiae TaxID=1784 RepID=A0A5B1BJ26_MYCSI|nr:IS481 family transposase [Mycobacterium simiae]KAA1248667.1 IS481 family transposase [Mycobacterium simiae]
MPHANAPLTPQGRRRLCERVDAGRPIAHVAAEAGISRRCLAKWHARWTEAGPAGLLDHSSTPTSSPGRTGPEIEHLVELVRRQTKYGAARISTVLRDQHQCTVAPVTVHRILVRKGISRVSDLDPPTGQQLRTVIRFEHDKPGSLVASDIKKIGRIPTGGGWWAHGRGSDGHRASKRRGQGTGAVGYTYLHSAIDDHSRLAYTEALENEKGVTAADFWLRAVVFFAEHGITTIHHVLTDNGACYRSHAWAKAVADTGTRHKRTRPYHPSTNGKAERFNGTLSREWAYAREYGSEEERRIALVDFLNFYNHERPFLGWLDCCVTLHRSATRAGSATDLLACGARGW